MAPSLKYLTFKCKNKDISNILTTQGSQECQKMHHYSLNLDLEVLCSNIQPKLKKLLNSTKNQSLFLAFGRFLKIIQFWLSITPLY